MDQEAQDYIAGALSAQAFILQNIYALICAQDPDPVAAAQRTRDELIRQFTDLPISNKAPMDAERMIAVTEHGRHHLERFWANVVGRLRNAEGRSTPGPAALSGEWARTLDDEQP